MSRTIDATSPYWIDNRARVKALQHMMGNLGIDVYLGTRIRTLSFILDAFCPWRSFLAIPREGDPVLYTFIVDAARVSDETWLDADNVRAYAPMGGQDQISLIASLVNEEFGIEKGR
ncbi:MAG: aminopeptidase P family protein, partial [Sphaerochaeta sp.]|nr:aminopeptidase P family protein [Sphaerochaeta sp.]